MTHFVAAVIVPAGIPTVSRVVHHKQFGGYDSYEVNDNLNGYLASALDKFDENKETPRYVEYTKEELIAKGREDIEKYKNGLYAQYLASPAEYVINHGYNERHIRYISTEFPEKLNWTDEQVYAEELRWYEPENIGPDGEVYSTYNPHSQWDWWQIGGRWHDAYRTRQGETVADFREHLNKILADLEAGKNLRPESNEVTPFDDPDRKLYWWFPYSVVIPGVAQTEKDDEIVVEDDYEWFTRGKMGWFGMSSDDHDEKDWVRILRDRLADVDQNDSVVYIDFHI